MKKLTTLMSAAIVLLASCGGPSNSGFVGGNAVSDDSIEVLNRELGVSGNVTEDFRSYAGSKVRFLVAGFVKDNPDCFNNEAMYEKYDDQLCRLVDDAIQKDKSLISDLNVTFDEIIDYNATDIKGNPACLIGCKSGDKGNGFASNDKFDYVLCFTVVGTMPREDAEKLRKDIPYKVSGCVASREDKGYNGSRFGMSNNDGKTIQLGCFFLDDMQLVEDRQ